MLKSQDMHHTIPDKILYRTQLQQFCAKNGLIMDVQAGDDYYQLGKGKIDLILKVFVKLVSILSFNTLSSGHVNLLYILRRKV